MYLFCNSPFLPTCLLTSERCGDLWTKVLILSLSDSSRGVSDSSVLFSVTGCLISGFYFLSYYSYHDKVVEGVVFGSRVPWVTLGNFSHRFHWNNDI